MHAEDATSGLELLIERGTLGMVYNIAPQGRERTNLEVAEALRPPRAVRRTLCICPVRPAAARQTLRDRRLPHTGARLAAGRVVDDRLMETVDWYRLHPSWWEPLLPEAEVLYSDELESSP